MAYKAPIWEDGKSPAISAENLNNLSQAAEGAQVLYGNSAPTSSTEGAVGQFYLVVVADANGNYALYQCVGISGSAYNWELLGTTPAYAKVSNPVAQTLRIPSGSSVEFALISNFAPIKIASYETAGSYQWTAPDLADGKAYKIGVMIIGAGGSGASASTSTKYAQYGGGGASGYAKSHIETVDPGETKNLVVGKGGTSVGGSSAVNGKPGGTSSFDGIAVDGGAEGHLCNSNSGGYGDRSIGARCGNPFGAGSFGFELPYFNNSSSDSTFDDIPWMCFNPFEGVEILGSGGSATWDINSTVTYKNGGKNTDGKGGGNAGNPGVNGELPGCGGGGTVNLKKSGAGADGAVYIYFLGVADE